MFDVCRPEKEEICKREHRSRLCCKSKVKTLCLNSAYRQHFCTLHAWPSDHASLCKIHSKRLPTSCCDHVLDAIPALFHAQCLATQQCSVLVLIPSHHTQQPPLLMVIVPAPLLTSLCQTDDAGQEAHGRLPVFLWKVLLVQMMPLALKRQAHSVPISAFIV